MRIKSIENLVNNLKLNTSGYFTVYADKVMPVDAILRLSDKLAELLKCEVFPLRNSIQYLSMIRFTEDARQLLYWRLSANVDVLRAGNAIPYYSRLTFPGTECIRFERVTKRDGRFITSFRVMTGHFAWGMASHSFSERGANRAMYILGYKAPKYPLLEPVRGLTGMYATAELTTESGRAISDIKEDASVVAFNRNIVRNRLQLSFCPKQLANRATTCVNCGLTLQECPMSLSMYSRSKQCQESEKTPSS